MMNDEINLIYPTIDLFLYDLRKGLGQEDAKLAQNRQQFWQKIYNNPQYNLSGKQLDDRLLAELAKAEKEEASFVQLLKSQQVEKFQLPLDGYYYPLQLGDSYALHVDCSGSYADAKEKPNYEPQPISNLHKIKREIVTHIGGEETKGKLGQTWMMSAQLPKNYQPKEIEQIAKKCYAELALLGDWESDFYAQGKFLDATVFELWRFPTSIENWQDSYHLLIWLFPSTPLIKSPDISSIYVDLIRLFYYRSKILWAYYQSRIIKTALEKDYLSIQDSVRAIALRQGSGYAQMNQPTYNKKLDSQQLQNILTDSLNILSTYAIDLSQLKVQAGTIQTNLSNYQLRLNQLAAKDPDKENNLEFITKFGDFATERYQGQVEADYENLSFGLTLIENLIRTIEGISQIRQTQSDRTLNYTIAAAGIGLATSQVAVSVLVDQKPTSFSVNFLRSPVFLLSILTGLSIVILLILGRHIVTSRKGRSIRR